MTSQSHPPFTSAELTRMALVQAALKLFGSKGFEGTSTRDIAALANANIGSIAYHFGSKAGLRVAAADHVVRTIRKVAGPGLTGDLEPAAGIDTEAARALLLAGLERMVNFIVAAPEAGDVVQFLLRELSAPTEALDRIYDGVFAPVHERLCQLWDVATGDGADAERTKLGVFTFIGQVVYFRIAREAVRRRMGWQEVGPDEAKAVYTAASRNLLAVFETSGSAA